MFQIKHEDDRVKCVFKVEGRDIGKSTHLLRPRIISGFPGIGKSYFVKNNPGLAVDSDSSKFSWIEPGVRHPEFPDNYIKHIKGLSEVGDGSLDVVLVSSHDVVRKAMREARIRYILMYPSKDSKLEYLKRYADRGSDDKFVKLLDENWDEWIDQLAAETLVTHCILQHGAFLSDVVSL